MSTSDRLWTRLYGGWGSPRRTSRMTGHDEPKYCDIKDYSLTRAMLSHHLAGHKTYAATLGAAGTARAGCKDYDSAEEAEILAALAAAAAQGITACAFLVPGDDRAHYGGHLWTFYDAPYAESDIRAQLRTIPRKGKGGGLSKRQPDPAAIRLP